MCDDAKYGYCNVVNLSKLVSIHINRICVAYNTILKATLHNNNNFAERKQKTFFFYKNRTMTASIYSYQLRIFRYISPPSSVALRSQCPTEFNEKMCVPTYNKSYSLYDTSCNDVHSK